jgi:hypothetical protein
MLRKCVCAVSVLLLFVAVGLADEHPKGTFVSFKDGKLTYTDKDKDATVIVAKEAKITLDGKAVKAEDLKAGVTVTLTIVKNEIVEVVAETKKEKDKEVKDKK